VLLVRGGLNVNGQSLQAGDALLVADESELTLSQGQDAEVLVFDLAP
jgi:redox-sensitive bicupin YhaK (pirin superfamily)